MTDPTQGWVKLWRKLLGSPEWLDLSPSGKCVLIVLLLRADWEMFGIIELSEREIAESAGVSRDVVRRALVHLQKTGFLRRATQSPPQKRNHPIAVYCIMKFEEYQSGEDEPAPAVGPQTTPMSIYKKEEEYYSPEVVKEAKKGKVRTPSSPVSGKIYDKEAHEIAELWMGTLALFTTGENAQREKSRALPRWLDALDKLHRLDKHSWPDIRQLVEWIVQDTGDGRGWSGWAVNCQSPKKLRDRNGDDVPYFTVISQRMQSESRREPAWKLPPDFPPE